MSFLKSCLNAIMKPAADPRPSAAYTFDRQRALLARVRTLLADIEKARPRLTEKEALVAASLPPLQAQARRALQANREDVARLALQRHHISRIEQRTLQAQIAGLDQEEQRLLLVEHRLVTQIEVYLARQEALASRYNAAESQVQLNKALQKVFRDLTDLDRIIDAAEARTDEMEARATWLEDAFADEQITAVAAGTPLQTLANLDLNQAVEDELARLKAQLGPPGRSGKES